MDYTQFVTSNWPWLALSFIWSLNGPVEHMLMQTHSAQAYAKAKAVAVGVAFLASPVEFDLAIFAHPLMWVLCFVSFINTPLNAFIIKHGTPITQLPLAQVISLLLRTLFWSLLDPNGQGALTPRKCLGILAAAVSVACLR